MEGYSYDRYVVHEITHDRFGYRYHLINLRTHEFGQCDIIRPLSQKFGIGYYFDEADPQFMDTFEIAVLKQEAEGKAKAEQKAQQRENKRTVQQKAIGRERLQNLIPADAQAVIVARLKQDESDSQTDYFASSTARTVILGFSTHKRDIFSEMRKHAGNFEETAHLTEHNEDYEHREKYSMGAGYYLSESKYHGWIIEKCPIYKRESTIEDLAYTAGDEANICVKAKVQAQANTVPEAVTGNFEIVDYSEKALAIFGDTRPIKDELKALGGRFNPKLTHEGEKQVGWIFSKGKE
jgi:hypothetical protein